MTCTWTSCRSAARRRWESGSSRWPRWAIAISASTAALIDGEFELRELGEFEVKGAPERQRVLELVGPGTAQTRLAALAATRGLSLFVGRESETAELAAALEHALRGGGRAIGIVGDAGVGKSRLVHEFVAGCAARGLAVNATGAVVAHGPYVPFLPVLALYRAYFGIADRDPPEVARGRIESTMLALDPAFAPDLPLLFEFLGVPDPDRPLALSDPVATRRRLLDVMTRAVKARSRHEAAVLVVEELHWIDDASDAFLEHLVEAIIGTRTLLICTYRPEYDDAWTRDGPHVRLGLGPLDTDATDDLLIGLLGSDPSLAGLTALIEARTRGNPFFIEEVVQALVETGHITGSRGQYRLASELHALVPRRCSAPRASTGCPRARKRCCRHVVRARSPHSARATWQKLSMCSRAHSGSSPAARAQAASTRSSIH